VTDAAAALGRFPTALVGGGLPLDVDSARSAYEIFGENWGLSLEEASAGVLEVAVAGQVAGIRQVSTLKGRDPGRYTLVAFGGAGPLLAAEVADFLGMRQVLVPPNPGNLSAFGLQVTDVKRDYVKTYVCKASVDVAPGVGAAWESLEQQGVAELHAEGVPATDVELRRGADLRYVGEGYEVTVTVPDGTPADQTLEAVVAEFHKEHDRVYGFSYDGAQDVELVNLRVQAVGRLRRPELKENQAAGGAVEPASRRKVYWRDTGWVEADIYNRADLGDGSSVEGPCVIEEYGATSVVPTGWVATADAAANLIIRRQDA
jgi:N-methylhydantoinase A